jgi:hypothetical protein
MFHKLHCVVHSSSSSLAFITTLQGRQKQQFMHFLHSEKQAEVVNDADQTNTDTCKLTNISKRAIKKKKKRRRRKAWCK